MTGWFQSPESVCFYCLSPAAANKILMECVQTDMAIKPLGKLKGFGRLQSVKSRNECNHYHRCTLNFDKFHKLMAGSFSMAGLFENQHTLTKTNFHSFCC